MKGIWTVAFRFGNGSLNPQHATKGDVNVSRTTADRHREAQQHEEA